MTAVTLGAGYFDAMYEAAPDPWGDRFRDPDNAVPQPAKPSPEFHGNEGFILDDKNIGHSD